MRGLADASLMLGAAILVIAALVHFGWPAGGRVGHAATIPNSGGRAVLPSRRVTDAAGLLIAVAGLLYAAVALGVLTRWLPASALRASVGVLGFVFLARGIGDFRNVGVFNRGGDTGFARADRPYYSPLCIFLGVSSLLAAAAHIP